MNRPSCSLSSEAGSHNIPSRVREEEEEEERRQYCSLQWYMRKDDDGDDCNVLHLLYSPSSCYARAIDRQRNIITPVNAIAIGVSYYKGCMNDDADNTTENDESSAGLALDQVMDMMSRTLREGFVINNKTTLTRRDVWDAAKEVAARESETEARVPSSSSARSSVAVTATFQRARMQLRGDDGPSCSHQISALT